MPTSLTTPRFMIAAVKRVARKKPTTTVIEATPEMFVEAIRMAHELVVP